MLKRAGAPTNPREIGIGRELFYQSRIEGHTVRPRYSILQFAKDNGLGGKVAAKITSEIYD